MYARSFNISVQGASHIRKNKICQDASASYSDDKITIAVVCDGHGGDDYVRSDKGSKFAAEAALQNIRKFVENISTDVLKENTDRTLTALEASIITSWNQSIREHCSQNPFTTEEIHLLSDKAKKKYLYDDRIESAYGTTLIAAVITSEYWFGIQLGDGKCVAVSTEGEFSKPIPWNEKCFLNATTSMCEEDALDNFRHFFSEKLPAAVFVGSDGIDDCFKTDDQLYNLYKTVMVSFSTSEFDEAVSELKEYLPRLSAKGSGDDVSIAAVLDMDKIGEIDSVKGFDREKEKARVVENAKLEAANLELERLKMEIERAKQAEAKFNERIREASSRAEAADKRARAAEQRAHDSEKLVRSLEMRLNDADKRARSAEQRASEAEGKASKLKASLQKFSPFSKQSMVCPDCGVTTSANKFCGNCGASLSGGASHQNPPVSRNAMGNSDYNLPVREYTGEMNDDSRMNEIRRRMEIDVSLSDSDEYSVKEASVNDALWHESDDIYPEQRDLLIKASEQCEDSSADKYRKTEEPDEEQDSILNLIEQWCSDDNSFENLKIAENPLEQHDSPEKTSEQSDISENHTKTKEADGKPDERLESDERSADNEEFNDEDEISDIEPDGNDFVNEDETAQSIDYEMFF